MSNQIMQSVQENELLSQLSAEESATLSGGGPSGYLQYIQLAQTPASPGGDSVNDNETHTGWNILINQTGGVGSASSS
jgi:hypothetical protein